MKAYEVLGSAYGDPHYDRTGLFYFDKAHADYRATEMTLASEYWHYKVSPIDIHSTLSKEDVKDAEPS